MTCRPNSHHRPRSAATRLLGRRGYTMIELLIVITIISILMAIVTFASVGFIGQARVAATQSTIKKVDEAILERVNAVNRFHMRPISRLRNDWDIRGWPQRWIAYGLDPFAGTGAGQQGSDDIKMVLSRKGMLMELLPVTQIELMQSFWFWAKFDTDGTPNYMVINKIPVPYLSSGEQSAMATWLADIDEDSSNNSPGTSPGVPSALDRPGEVFLYALLHAPVFGAQRMMEDDFQSSEFIDPDEDGIPELGDSWGNAIRFYRWPTRLVNNGEFTPPRQWGDNVGLRTLIPNAPLESLRATPAPPRYIGDLHQDPDDRAGYMSLTNPVYGMPIAGFFHDVDTWHTPLLVSAGADGLLGLEEPEFTDSGDPFSRPGLAQPKGPTSDEELFDNVTNHNSDGGL